MSGPLPVIGDVDYQAIRRELLAMRARMREIEETVDSADGLITATVDGRGRLVGLVLNPRVLRTTDSRLLAKRITATVRSAAELARDRLGTTYSSILAGEQPRGRS